MLDLAGIAFYPRIYDLAHRFFEESWEEICGIDYPTILLEKRFGFPVVNINSQFHSPINYGDNITATIWISEVGLKSCTWEYQFHNQAGVLLWSSKQVTVCMNLDSMSSVEIPDFLRNGLERCAND
jgi:YbgC/YbaW family acyl-CoA thioester hydrolase